MVVRAVAVVGLLGILGAGCSDDEAANPNTSAVGSSQNVDNVVKPVTGEPKKGGVLTVGLEAESQGYNPATSQMAGSALTVSYAIFDPLTIVGDDMQPKPFLAQSFTPANDFKQWDIKLRPNIKFHNDEPLNATSLKKFIDAVRASALVGPALRPITDTTIIDDLTVRATLKQSWSAFPLVFTVQPGLVAAPAQLDAKDTRNPIGTGPFRFGSWETDRQLVVNKNPNYWRAGQPYLDRIEFKPIADNQARYKALQAGSIDVMVSPREQTIQDLIKDGKNGAFQVLQAKGDNDVNMLMMNTSKGPFKDPRLRQAIVAAIDQKGILALTNSGEDLAADSVWAKDSPWYAPDNGYPKYDPQKAQSLVKEIQGETGPVRLTLFSVPDPDVLKNVQVIQEQLRTVGIELTVNTIEQAALIGKVVSGEYDFCTWRQFGAADPDGNYNWWIGENAVGSPALNFARNQDPKIDEALNKGRASSDPKVRKDAYATVQKQFSIDLPYAFTTHLRYTMGVNNRVRNIEHGTTPEGTKTAGLISSVIPVTEMWIDPQQ
jgi:peptide/nickel transport system substrate-binding protein